MIKLPKLLLSLILVLFTINTAKAQQTLNESIIHDNLHRDYILYVPSSYIPGIEIPLLFNFHGYSSNASQQMWYGSFIDIAENEGFIIVHPEGTLDNSGITHFNVGWGGSNVDDVGFTSALIDSVSSEYSINQNRVYSTGMSNGGFMSYKLACELSDRIAAIASVTGSMNIGLFNNCNSQHPMPIMEIHGTNDQTVPYSGDPTWTESINDVLQYWVDYNNCNLNADTTIIPDLVLGDWSTAEHIVYDGGDNSVTTEHYKIIGGEHTWPGAPFVTGVTNYDIDASEKIWEFFSKYDINGLIGTNTFIEDKTIKDRQLVKITDILGRKLSSESNTLLFYIYDDGTVEKIIVIE